jgi:undecaprenyl-diphosphatase
MNADVAPSRRVLLVAALFVVTAMTLFVLIAEDLSDGAGLISHDEAVLRWFVDHRTDWMVHAARFVSVAGGFVSLLCVGVLFGLWLWRRGWYLGIAFASVISLLVAFVAATVAKAIFGRPRPPLTFHEVHVASPAFPSGHATNAAGFFLAAAFVLSISIAHQRRSRLVAFAIGIVCAALVGVSRLILAVHWLSDVIAGWALGTAIAITTVVVAWYATTHATTPSPRRDGADARSRIRRADAG